MEEVKAPYTTERNTVKPTEVGTFGISVSYLFQVPENEGHCISQNANKLIFFCSGSILFDSINIYFVFDVHCQYPLMIKIMYSYVFDITNI